jgi:RNA polymerase sigma-70 factor (ECF subfamily)
MVVPERFVIEQDLADFERLVRENQRVVYQIAYSVLGNAADAQDVTQDVFVRAHARLGSLRDPAQFRGWVCRIARHTALNRIRSDARTRRREDDAAQTAARSVDVETVAEGNAFETAVRAEIDRLPQKLRAVLLLCAIEGLEPAEVAKLLGIPPGTVRSRLHLARKRLLGALAL